MSLSFLTLSHRQRWVLVAISAALLTACQDSQRAAVPQPAVSQPATVAQAAPDYTISAIAAGLEHPWGMAWLPDGDLLITERPGRLRRWDGTELRTVTGIPTVFNRGQGGLLDVAVHPQFAENGWVYFTYAAGSRSANQTQVARARLADDTLRDWQVIFTVAPAKPGAQHFGSRLLWLPDGTLLVSTGDGGNPPIELDNQLIRLQAQRLDSDLGKVLRLQDDGSIPADNPAIEGQPPSAVWSYGHRNIQGLAYDAERQAIWATEHGARGGDELNQLRAGENYGWPLVSHSREYATGRPVSPVQSQPGMVDPQLLWTPSMAPSGLAVYQGSLFPQWRGSLFAGALVDRDIKRLSVDAQGSVREVETIPIGERVRAVAQGPDESLYVLTDERAGRLLKISPE